MKLKVVNWITYEKAGYYESAGAAGMEAVKDYIRATREPIDGFDHQNNRIPLFNDGTVLVFSLRAWGGLMAQAMYGDDIIEFDQLAYVRFAWDRDYYDDEDCYSDSRSVMVSGWKRAPKHWCRYCRPYELAGTKCVFSGKPYDLGYGIGLK